MTDASQDRQDGALKQKPDEKKPLKNKVAKHVHFVKTDIWQIRSSDYDGVKSALFRIFKTILLAVRGFKRHKCQLRASALTFFTLLSIVPIVAMAFGVAKGFGFEKMLRKELLEQFQGQEEVMERVIGFAVSFLETSKGGVIAGVGIIVLFWTVIKVLGHIEMSLNAIWDIKKARTIGRKFSDYLSVMLICPVLLIMSGSITVMITSQVKLIMQKISILGIFAPVIFSALKLLPYGVIWVLFSVIYILMPNTKVRFRAGIIGGVAAGTTYQLVQWAYITFQIGVAKYGAIYGSFAALPLFLIWLQMSWLIVLLGAEISYAEQNYHALEFELDGDKASLSFRKKAALAIAWLVVKNFKNAEDPLTALDIADRLELPVFLVEELLDDLTEARALSEINVNNGKEIAYQPARDINRLDIAAVLKLLEGKGDDGVHFRETPEIKKISDSLRAMGEKFESSPENLPLSEI